MLLPLDSLAPDTAQLSTLDDVKAWGLIFLDAGRAQEINIYPTREEIKRPPECVVVQSKDVYIWPFMEEGLGILIAPVQRSIEDIVEAYMFRELHDING